MATREMIERHQPDFSQSAGMPAVAPMQGVERVFGAQHVQVHRDESKVLQKLKTLAAAAGGEWYYRFPVKNRQTNSTDWIEGPSIKLANDLCRIYGNCDVDTRMVDLGDSWLFYARFIDLESGFSLTRPFQQRKSQANLNTRDPGRALDIAFQIGCSKAIRNVIINALQTFGDFAFDEARNALVNKVGADLDSWRKRTVDGIAKIPVDLKRVELVVGRAAKDWLAPDVARVIAMMKSIADGMASVDETFPDPDAKPPEPARRPETVADAMDQLGAAGEGDPPGAAPRPTTDAGQDASDRTSGEAPASGGAEGGGLFKEQPGAPPTDPATYKAFVRKVLNDAAGDPEAVARLAGWFASDGQQKMRAACRISKADFDELQGWLRALAKPAKRN